MQIRELFRTKSLDALVAETHEEGHQLKKVLGPWNLIALGIGAIIGAGSSAAAVPIVAKMQGAMIEPTPRASRFPRPSTCLGRCPRWGRAAASERSYIRRR